MGALLAGVLSGGLAILVGLALFRSAAGDLDLLPLLVVGGLALIIGIMVASVMLGLVRASVHTILVCSAEVPETLRTVHPEIWEALTKSYGEKLTFTDQDLFAPAP